MNLEEKKLSSRQIYKCSFLEVYEDVVLLTNNKQSKRIYIKHCGAAAVLPITIDGKVILVKQFRYPIGKITLEIPAGKKDFIGEDGKDCARRELEEETGFTSKDISRIKNIHTTVGFCDELIEIFLAKDCTRLDIPRECDDDEFIELLYISKEEVQELLYTHITDSKTIIALQYYLL